jgi:hypothetical protein
VARVAEGAVAAKAAPVIVAVAGVRRKGDAKCLQGMWALQLHFTNTGEHMEYLMILAAISFGGWWLYKSGKRDGSRKGFGAGRRAHRCAHRRNKRRR